MNYRKTYKKRKAFHITIIAISVIAGLYFNMMLPGVIRDNVPCVDVIFPERTEYIPSYLDALNAVRNLQRYGRLFTGQEHKRGNTAYYKGISCECRRQGRSGTDDSCC